VEPEATPRAVEDSVVAGVVLLCFDRLRVVWAGISGLGWLTFARSPEEVSRTMEGLGLLEVVAGDGTA
jgi:hypothetical protein